PMLFWPGVPGEFMGMLPVTLIFVLSASLVVALVYLPVMGGVSGRMSRLFGRLADGLRARLPWVIRAALVPLPLYGMFVALMELLNPGYILPPGTPGTLGFLAGGTLFIFCAFAASVILDAAALRFQRKRITSGYRRSVFGWVIHLIAGNPVMPIVSVAAIFAGVFYVAFVLFPANSKGVEFFVESEPEQATVYVRARGNLSLAETDAMVRQVEAVVSAHPAVINVFAFAGDGGLKTGGPGQQSPGDTVGQVQFEIIPWEDRPKEREAFFGGRFHREVAAAAFDGNLVIDQLTAELDKLPGFETEVTGLEQGPGSGKPIHLRLKGDGWDDLTAAANLARAHFEQTPGLIQIEDTLPLPGIDWQINVDVEKAGRFGADVATVGAMVQLVTRGILLDTMRVDTSDEEIEIRVRLPAGDRVLSTLDTLKVRTRDGLVPLSNFVTREPVKKLAKISRVDQKRYYDVKADVLDGIQILQMVPLNDNGSPVGDGAVDVGFGYAVSEDEHAAGAPANVHLKEKTGWLTSFFRDAQTFHYNVPRVAQSVDLNQVQRELDRGTASVRLVPMNANERIGKLTEWLETNPLPASIGWEWTGDQQEQEESGAFLQNAFLGALGLMFIILLAQFNSFYNSILVLLAVVLSTTGVLIGMMVMGQPFSIIMTGTGIVALAGIVVNNNIVLIYTY
ncbi:MAG: efflux RND transporter permease subunit, partial [Pseudooceanicola sp.]|nr:efflux RND transporter permease subunit [Pseudooceanicola sp.]